MRDCSVRRDSIVPVMALALAVAVAGCSPVAGPTPGTGSGSAGATGPAPGGTTAPPRTGTAAGPLDGATAHTPTSTAAPVPESRAGATTDLRPAALPGWASDDLSGIGPAIDGQCALRRPPAPWVQLCAEFQAQRPRLREWIERRFAARPLVDGQANADGLITGYHEPELRGSRTRTRPGQVPLYRRPPDAQLRARPTRTDIEVAAPFAGSELAWIDDPIEAFFLQVQGSGRIRLDDGSLMRVGYAGDNGLPYKAIGATLIERGALSAADANAGTIKAWLRANPAQAAPVMRTNPRYIFFRELAPQPVASGPPGSLGVPLTPLRSIAVDPARVPPGALLWLDTTDPLDGRVLRQLVVAQDTGAAIVGAVRADLFWGTGPRAEQAAGLMKQRGRLWLLQPLQPLAAQR